MQHLLHQGLDNTYLPEPNMHLLHEPIVKSVKYEINHDTQVRYFDVCNFILHCMSVSCTIQHATDKAQKFLASCQAKKCPVLSN